MVMRRLFFIFLITFIIISGISLSSFAQSEQNQTQAQPQEKQQTPEETARNLVTAIEIKGNKNISSNTIISKIKTKIDLAFARPQQVSKQSKV